MADTQRPHPELSEVECRIHAGTTVLVANELTPSASAHPVFAVCVVPAAAMREFLSGEAAREAARQWVRASLEDEAAGMKEWPLKSAPGNTGAASVVPLGDSTRQPAPSPGRQH